MWIFFALLVVIIVYTFGRWAKLLNLKNDSNNAKTFNENHKFIERELKDEIKNNQNNIPKTNYKISEMKDDDNNKDPKRPNEPGAAGGDIGMNMQRDINETKTPILDNFNIKGYTVDNISSLLNGEENNFKYDNGDTFTGEIWDGWRHGIGKYEFWRMGSWEKTWSGCFQMERWRKI